MSLFPCRFSLNFGKARTFLLPAINTFAKIGCGIFLQKPCHKLDEKLMSMLWDWRLPSPPLWCMCSSLIYWWLWIRVYTPCHWNGTIKYLIGLTTSPFPLAVLGGPVVPMILIIPLCWHGEITQQLFGPHILNQTSQIIYGEYYWSFICGIIGSETLVKEQSSIFQDFPSYLVTPNTS